jgi:hypothetical protein
VEMYVWYNLMSNAAIVLEHVVVVRTRRCHHRTRHLRQCNTNRGGRLYTGGRARGGEFGCGTHGRVWAW